MHSGRTVLQHDLIRAPARWLSIGHRRIVASTLVVFAVFALAFGWGAAMVQLRWWPYDILKVFGNRPSVQAVANQNDARRSIFDAFSPQVDVVFLGDSRVAQAEWQDMLPEFRSANRGIGAEDFAQIATRLDDVIALNPRIVVLAGGINNGRRYSLDETMDQHRQIVDALEAAGITVVLSAPIVCNCDRQAFVSELAQRIRQFADANGNSFVDPNGRLSMEAGLDPAYTFDGTHLTGPGYEQWREALRPNLSELLGDSSRHSSS